jgi:hypothetical protein
MADRVKNGRQARIEEAMIEFYKRPVPEQVIEWNTKKYAQEKNPRGECVICKSLKIPKGIGGIGASFEKHSDGRLTATCGGRGGEPVCPGYEIMREIYVDQATITSEIREAMRFMRKELKTIRDRVLANEELTREDEKTFRELTGEYIRLKQIEDAHKEEIEKLSTEYNTVIVEDDEILVPDAYFGKIDDEPYEFKTPMIIQNDASFVMPEIKAFHMSREDIPVLLRIDEATDDA